MLLDFTTIQHDSYGKVEQPVLMVKTPDGRILGTVSNYYGLSCTFRFNDVSEIEFSVPAYYDDQKNNGYDLLDGMRQINVDPYGDFILINPSIKNEGGKKEIKTCTAYSLEYAFNYKKAELPAGTYNFYNPVDNADCITQMIIEFMPDWSFGTIDRELIGRWRTFDQVDDNLYSFMMNTLQESYNCLFLFDTYNKKINVISANQQLSSVPVYLSYNNLLKSVEITELTDEVVTALSGYGSGDEVNIRPVNPNGTNTIYNLDYFIGNGDLSGHMADRWTEYMEAIGVYQQVFSNLNVLYTQKINEQSLSEAKYYVLKTDYDAINTAYLTAATQAGSDEEYDKEIADLKKKLADKKAECDAQQEHTEMLKKDVEAVNKQLDDIVKICKISNFFSKEELDILTQYFVQDSIAEETFVIPEYSSAIMESTSNVLAADNKASVKIVGSEIYMSNIAEVILPDENGKYNPTQTDPDSGEEGTPDGPISIFSNIELPEDIAKTVADQLNNEAKMKAYEFRGGTMEFKKTVTETVDGKETSRDVTLKGDVVNVDFHYNIDNLDSYVDENSDDLTKSGYFVLTANLRNAEFDGTTFPNINVSISGMLLGGVPFTGKDFLAFDIDNAVFYSTASTTEYQKQAVLQELYEYTQDSLAKLAEPAYEFSIESGNFLFAKEFEPFKDSLELGKTIFLSLDDEEIEQIKPILVEISINYDDETDFSITFSNKYRTSHPEFVYADLITDMTHTSHSVSLNKASYSAYKDSKAGNQVENLTKNNLDVARNNIVNSSNQGVEWNSSGMFLRQTLPTGKYSPEQIGFINNLIAMTDDAWDTVKLAIGHFTDKNVGDTWGIVAPNITGTLLAGNNLVIENTVLDESGMEVIKQFKVDGSGAFLNNAAFCLTQQPDPTTGHPGGKILIDPNYGIAMGNINMFTQDGTNIKPTFMDEDGNIIWDESKVVETADGSVYYVPENTKFFFDINTGNAYFGGTISGEDIVVNTINGNAIKDMSLDAGSKLTGDVNSEQIYKNVIEAINKYVKFSDETGSPIVSMDTAVIKDLSADNFVGGSITADTVKTDGLSANVIEAINASIGMISADRLDVSSLKANHIVIDGNGGKFIIDPEYGLAAGNSNLFTIDENDNVVPNFLDEDGNLIIDPATKAPVNSTLYYDIKTGNTYFSGNISANQITSGKLTSDYLDIKEGYIKSAMVENLSAGKIIGGNIAADVMQANVISAINSYIGSATINSAKIGNLDASKITSGEIDASKIKVKNLDASQINTGLLSSDYMQIKDGFIKNAMIEGLSADKILSGSIYTNKVNVQSEDGGFSIIGNTAQWLDKNGKVRMQAGRDASDNFTFAVFGEDGSTAYFDQTGLKSAGVPDGIIVNDMVSDAANISAGKLDIASLFDKINEDGSHTINTSKIYFNDKAQSLEVYLSSVETKADNATAAANANAEDLTKFTKTVNDSLSDMQGQIDGSIMTWFYEYEPANDNYPATEWTTVALKNNHLGDLFYDTITGYCYRWQVLDNQYSWQRITDVDVTKALADAKNAQTTADNKRRVFFGTDNPTPPYDAGDVWMQGEGGDIKVCKVAKSDQQSFAAADWAIASKYTDDTLASTAITKIGVEQGRINTLVQRVDTTEGTLAETKTQAEQTADKFTWLVSSGDSATNFTLTDKFVEIVSGKLDIAALVEFKNAAQTGSSTVINGGAIDTDTLRAGSISIGNPNMTLLDYLFSTEEHITYDEDGNVISSELVGKISNINETIDDTGEKLSAFGELITGDGGIQDDIANLGQRYTSVNNRLEDYTTTTNSTLADLRAKFDAYPDQNEVRAALNLIAENNNKEILQYGSLLKYITADPINGLVIHGIDPILDSSGNIQYNKKQKYDYAYNAETGQYVYEPVIDDAGNPVMVDDPTNPICNESPYSVNINNTSFAIKKNNETITDITGSTMNISEAHIKNQFRIKNYGFSPSTSNDGVEVLNLFYQPE